jgi:hypothetical protein
MRNCTTATATRDGGREGCEGLMRDTGEATGLEEREELDREANGLEEQVERHKEVVAAALPGGGDGGMRRAA